MLAPQQSARKICQKCGWRNEAYMRFCIACGSGFGALIHIDCEACGNSDTLNGPFCISCGAVLPAHKVQAGPPSRFRWQQNGKQQGAPVAFGKQGLDPEHARKWATALAIVAGVSLGVLAALALAGAPEITSMIARRNWPSKGFLVYCREPCARISIENLASNSASHYEAEVGVLSNTGTATIEDLVPGKYLFKIENPGRKAVAQAVTIESERLTVVGFPHKVELPQATGE
jgi:hypothetical protein